MPEGISAVGRNMMGASRAYNGICNREANIKSALGPADEVANSVYTGPGISYSFATVRLIGQQMLAILDRMEHNREGLYQFAIELRKQAEDAADRLQRELLDWPRHETLRNVSNAIVGQNRDVALSLGLGLQEALDTQRRAVSSALENIGAPTRALGAAQIAAGETAQFAGEAKELSEALAQKI
jgi:hypothetical protein